MHSCRLKISFLFLLLRRTCTGSPTNAIASPSSKTSRHRKVHRNELLTPVVLLVLRVYIYINVCACNIFSALPRQHNPHPESNVCGDNLRLRTLRRGKEETSGSVIYIHVFLSHSLLFSFIICSLFINKILSLSLSCFAYSIVPVFCKYFHSVSMPVLKKRSSLWNFVNRQQRDTYFRLIVVARVILAVAGSRKRKRENMAGKAGSGRISFERGKERGR